MKYGMIAQIRVNTKDCLAVLDLMGVLGIDPYDGRSFAQCVSLALSSMIQTMRDRGVIEQQEDGFQYLNRMAPFLGSRNNKRKYLASEALGKAMGEGVPALTIPKSVNVKHPGQYIPEAITGFTESGVTDSAAQPLILDEETKELLMEELENLYKEANRENGKLPPEKEARLQYLNKLLYT